MFYTNAQQKIIIAEIEAIYEKLKPAHRLCNPHDTDIVHYLDCGDTVEIWWEAGGEPPTLRSEMPKDQARWHYKNLRNEHDFDVATR